jgi:histidinol-phosphate aminotransferase
VEPPTQTEDEQDEGREGVLLASASTLPAVTLVPDEALLSSPGDPASLAAAAEAVAAARAAELAALAAGGAEAGPEAPPPPKARDAVARAHRVPRGMPDRSGFLRLDLGESPRPASPRVLAALQCLPPEDLSRYPDVQPLQVALAIRHGVPPEAVTVTAGSDDAIRWTFNAYVEEGARVVIPRPTFGAFLAAAEAGGAFVERIDHQDDLSLSPDAVRRLLSPRTPRLVVLANPNAPTGSAMAISEILDLAKESPSTLFLLNESFVSFHGESVLDAGRARTLPANLLVLRSFSKDYGIAGLRVGWLLGHPDVIGAIDLVRPSYTVASTSIAAAMAALEDDEARLAHVANVRGVMDRLVAKLNLRGIESRSTRANFVLVRLSAPIQPWAAAFAANKVLVGTWGHIGPLAPFIRVTVNDDHEVQRFLDVLDLLLRHGIGRARRVQGVPGNWEEVGKEGMA